MNSAMMQPAKMTQAGSRPTIFNIAGNRVGLNVIPHGPAAGQPVSSTPHKQGSLQGVCEMRNSPTGSMKKVEHGSNIM